MWFRCVYDHWFDSAGETVEFDWLKTLLLTVGIKPVDSVAQAVHRVCGG